MKKILIILSILILILVGNKENQKIIIPNKSIRIRVIANSNSLEDQMIKLKVKENITKTLYKKLENTKSIEEARNDIKSSIPQLNNIISNTLNNDNFSINYGSNYFPEKELYGINYNSGDYESLVVNIGKSKGNNWWCVLFPPLCMIETDTTDNNYVEYKSKVLEIIKRFE